MINLMFLNKNALHRLTITEFSLKKYSNCFTSVRTKSSFSHAEASWSVIYFLVFQSSNKRKQTLEGPSNPLEGKELRGNPQSPITICQSNEKELRDHISHKHWKAVPLSTVPREQRPIPMVWSMK